MKLLLLTMMTMMIMMMLMMTYNNLFHKTPENVTAVFALLGDPTNA